jgi:chemotaxis response regulator CheB
MKIALITANTAEANAVRRFIRADTDFDLAWSADTLDDGIARARVQAPDVIMLGLEPGAADAVRRLMKEAPVVILLLATSIDAQAGTIFDALGAGAADVGYIVDADGREAPDAASNLLTKLSILRRLRRDKAGNGAADRTVADPRSGRSSKPNHVVLLGASAGGPSAIATVLSALPATFAAPVVIVQHIDEQFAAGMAEWLGHHSTLPVRIAQDNQRMDAGVVYLAGRGDHLVFRDRYTLQYRAEPRDHAYRPSIDELFLSAARYWKGDAIAALLTGMGQDGALGLKALRSAGALTITQDQESSVVYGIPKAAARMNAALMILPLDKIGSQIVTAISNPSTSS